MTSSPEPRISVVSPVRNVARYLPDLLAALAAQTLPADAFETIVVDDRSADATPELLRAWEAAEPLRRRVLRGEGLGPATARNLGVAAARAPWVAFTDGDTIPDPRWLEALLAAGADADAVEGAVLRWPPDAPRTRVHTVENTRGGLYVTANMAYRRALLERLGGFDERFRAAFLEDSDLAFRALDAGARIPFAADAVVRHRVLERTSRQTIRDARKLQWLPLLQAKHPRRYAEEIRPILRPLTRPEWHVLVGLAALPVLGVRGAPRAVAALAALNAVRVVARDPRLDVAPRERPGQAALAAVLPLVKAAWWTRGWARARLEERR
ncbi:MAG TPA: glycosyltransferase [Gaiellaceae bacterium]|nr:glycosyltransferase [Gaiellaceae bacterium]